MSEIAIQGEVLPELSSLAVEANRQHAECERAYGSALEHAWHAGRVLLDAKVQLKHGEWLPWLEKNFKGTDRHARNYMKLAAEANRQRVSDLTDSGSSVRAALKELSSSNGQSNQPEARLEPCPTCGRPMRVDKPARGRA